MQPLLIKKPLWIVRYLSTGQLNWPLNEGKLLSDFKSRKKSVGCKKKLFPIRMYAGPLVSGEKHWRADAGDRSKCPKTQMSENQSVQKTKCPKQ
jgi:hypothetical protein